MKWDIFNKKKKIKDLRAYSILCNFALQEIDLITK